MECVEGAGAEPRSMAAAQKSTGFECLVREGGFVECYSTAITCKMCNELLRLSRGKVSSEHVLRNRMRPLRYVQWSKPQRRILGYTPTGLLRIPIGQVERNQNAGVRVGGQ